MTIPRIAAKEIPIHSRRALKALARRIARTITRYPYFAVVSGFDTAANEAEIKAIASMMGGLGRRAPDVPPALSFTRVSVNPDAVRRTRKATAYSRTHLPLMPHTDSSYLAEPHDLVAFQCVVADEGGGENAMVAMDDVLDCLTPEEIERLHAPAFPFSRGYFPVLEGDACEATIRYYRTQIDQAVADGATLSETDRALLDQLDEALAGKARRFVFKLKEGEAVFFANRKVLHARTGFAEDSNRTLFRVRHSLDLKRAARGGILAWLSGLKDRTEEEHTAEDPLKALREQVAHNPDDPDLVRRLSKLLAVRGAFTEAASWNERALELTPSGYDNLLLRSCLRHDAGDLAGAQAALGLLASHYPFEFPRRVKPGRPNLLRVRGLKDAKYQLRASERGFEPSLEGGHFSVSNFLNEQRYNVCLHNVFDTPAAWPDDRPAPDIVLNTIACADRMTDSLKALSKFLAAWPGVPVINHPDKVLQTTREQNCRRLGAIDGVVFPKTERVHWDGGDTGSMVSAITEKGFSYPLVLRPVETHTGVEVALAADTEAVQDYFKAARAGRDYYFIQYHDLSDARGHFRKSRTFCIDGRYYPVASLVHSGWNVHSGDRYSLMADSEDMQAAEQAYLSDFEGWLGPENMARLEAVRERVDLEFFGIDFCKLEDGRLFIFECNAAMRHNYDHVGAFPYTEPYLDRVSDAFDAMLEARAGITAQDWEKMAARARQF